jgi:hypothetical protein
VLPRVGCWQPHARPLVVGRWAVLRLLRVEEHAAVRHGNPWWLCCHQAGPWTHGRWRALGVQVAQAAPGRHLLPHGHALHVVPHLQAGRGRTWPPALRTLPHRMPYLGEHGVELANQNGDFPKLAPEVVDVLLDDGEQVDVVCCCHLQIDACCPGLCCRPLRSARVHTWPRFKCDSWHRLSYVFE